MFLLAELGGDPGGGEGGAGGVAGGAWDGAGDAAKGARHVGPHMTRPAVAGVEGRGTLVQRHRMLRAEEACILARAPARRVVGVAGAVEAHARARAEEGDRAAEGVQPEKRRVAAAEKQRARRIRARAF